MKHSLKKIVAIMLVVLFATLTCVYAKGNSVKDFDNKYVKEYKKQVEEFEDKYEELKSRLELAYDKNDAEAYTKAKRELRALNYPYMSEETSKEIEKSLKKDDYELAEWLYENSSYYQPVLRLECSKENFEYSNAMSTTPGTEVILPELYGFNAAYKFAGWGVTDSAVTYKAGDSIKMPVNETKLYAIFEKDSSIKEGKHLEISEKTGLELEKGKQKFFEFTIKNSGTETIKDLEINFDSDDPLLVVLNNNLSCYYLPTAEEGVASFPVITKAASGTKLKGVITVTDADNTVWTDEVVFTVK